MQRILSYLRRAAADFNMISENDKIAVGVSGGKDSIALMLALNKMRQFYDVTYSITAISVNMGFEDLSFDPLKRLCHDNDIELIIKDSQLAQIIFETRKEKSPCSLCSKMRHGILHKTAKEHACNKVALGHHNDDVLETFFLCLFNEGRIDCFLPVTYLDKSDITLIRPFIYLPEKEIIRFSGKESIPVIHNPCPVNGYTHRQKIKDFISGREKAEKGFKKRIFSAITGGIEGYQL